MYGTCFLVDLLKNRKKDNVVVFNSCNFCGKVVFPFLIMFELLKAYVMTYLLLGDLWMTVKKSLIYSNLGAGYEYFRTSMPKPPIPPYSEEVVLVKRILFAKFARNPIILPFIVDIYSTRHTSLLRFLRHSLRCLFKMLKMMHGSQIHTGASTHRTLDPSMLHSAFPYLGSDDIMVGNGETLEITHVG